MLFLTATALTLLMAFTARDSAASGWEYSASTVAPWWAMWSAVALWALMLEALRRAGGTALFVIMAMFSLYPLFAARISRPLRLGVGVAARHGRLPHLLPRERAGRSDAGVC